MALSLATVLTKRMDGVLKKIGGHWNFIARLFNTYRLAPFARSNTTFVLLGS